MGLSTAGLPGLRIPLLDDGIEYQRVQVIISPYFIKGVIRMLNFLKRIPLVRDYVMLFPDALEFHECMSRKAFWKAIGGFLLSYLVISLFGIFIMYWYLPHVHPRGWRLLADMAEFLPVLFCLFSFLPILAAQARRLLDARLSRWWLLLTLIPYLGWFILLVMLLLPRKSFEKGREFSAPPRY